MLPHLLGPSTLPLGAGGGAANQPGSSQGSPGAYFVPRMLLLGQEAELG